eukprot:SAG22_NODE_175_length_16235_cov_67.112729_3_plen_125_part_00
MSGIPPLPLSRAAGPFWEVTQSRVLQQTEQLQQLRMSFWFSAARLPACQLRKTFCCKHQSFPNMKGIIIGQPNLGRTQFICDCRFLYGLISIAAASPYVREEQIQIQPAKFGIWLDVAYLQFTD